MASSILTNSMFLLDRGIQWTSGSVKILRGSVGSTAVSGTASGGFSVVHLIIISVRKFLTFEVTFGRKGECVEFIYLLGQDSGGTYGCVITLERS